MSDSLLQRVARGDPRAVEECVDRYGGLIWSLARRRLADRAEIEDAVQDVFITLWKNAGRFDPVIASETTFVAMIARRRLIDHHRNAQRRITPTVAIEEAPVASPDRTGTETAELSDEAALAREALASLRPEQQQALRLSIFDGWSHQQIADHLRVPLGTVKTHVRRGLIQIREWMETRRRSGAREVAS